MSFKKALGSNERQGREDLELMSAGALIQGNTVSCSLTVVKLNE